MMPSTLEDKLEKILTKRKKYKAIRYSLYVFIFLLVIGSIQTTIMKDTDWEKIGTFGTVVKAVARFFPPDFSLIPHLVKPTIETFMIACLGTFLALVLAIPVSWFAAHNITPYKSITYPIGRAIMTLSRSVHEIVWGLIFVAAVGLGAFPGIMAVAMRSIGFISKLTAEAIEDINPGQMEAIRATGANGFQVILYAVIPQILPVFVGNTIFQWDINIRRATIMGLVGAGGLGLTFHRQLVMYNYGGVTTVIIALLLLIAIGEIGSYYIRKAII
ncbi:MAG: phosphonate ABC transporter, permease protein PhnE [Proteobacteria bacterium]|nr:phosphonate ABC transporter, permease protein PhnE [Pseudomonadota bacterium]